MSLTVTLLGWIFSLSLLQCITFSMKDAILETGQKKVLEGSIFMLPTFWISLCVINTSRTAYIAGYAGSKFTYVLHKGCKEKFVQPSNCNL